MRYWFSILLAILLLTSCSTTRKVVSPSAKPTAEVKKATLTIGYGKNLYTFHSSLQAVEDSICVLSIQPMAGIELFALRATQDSICLIDRVNHRYAKTTYQKLNSLLPRKIQYKNINRLIFPYRLIKDLKKEYALRILNKDLKVEIDCPAAQYNSPLRLREARIDNYQQVDFLSLIPHE